MKKEHVWWSLVNSSVSLINELKDSISNEESVFLCCEKQLPWKNVFYDALRNSFAEISSQRSFEILSAADEEEPGRFLMMRMCPKSVRNEYWPDMSYAEFLAGCEDIVLNNRIVLIKDIENEVQLEKWFDFISDYIKTVSEKPHPKALFIIEYNGCKSEKTPPRSIRTALFSPSYFDRYIFCLSMLSELKEQFSVKQYISELACCLCMEDTELCGDLIEEGSKLVQLPEYCAKSVISVYCNSHTKSLEITDDEIISCILMAQIKVIFPVIEQFRMQFIKSNDSKIRTNLPVVNAFNEKIEEPSALELSDLCSISRNYMSGFTDEDVRLLKKYRSYRNMLAHNSIIGWQEIKSILNK